MNAINDVWRGGGGGRARQVGKLEVEAGSAAMNGQKEKYPFLCGRDSEQNTNTRLSVGFQEGSRARRKPACWGGRKRGKETKGKKEKMRQQRPLDSRFKPAHLNKH